MKACKKIAHKSYVCNTNLLVIFLFGPAPNSLIADTLKMNKLWTILSIMKNVSLVSFICITPVAL